MSLKTTIIVTCFERMKELEHFLDSVDKYYKGYRILVANSGKSEPTFKIKHRKKSSYVFQYAL